MLRAFPCRQATFFSKAIGLRYHSVASSLAIAKLQLIYHLDFCLDFCLTARRKALPVQPFDLQRTEQRFGDSVIPASVASAHRRMHAESREVILEVADGVLAASVGMGK
jgi:hypothetical protein